MLICMARSISGQALPRSEAVWPLLRVLCGPYRSLPHTYNIAVRESVLDIHPSVSCGSTYDDRHVHIQGPRESMEDCAYVIPRARCGFLFAGGSLNRICMLQLSADYKSSTHCCMPLSLMGSLAVRQSRATGTR